MEKQKMFEREIESVNDSDKISKTNKEIILEFARFKQSEGLGFNRLNRIIIALKQIASDMQTNLDSLDINDVQNIAIKINTNPEWKDWTKATNVKVLKNFIRWLNKNKGLAIDLQSIKPIKPKNSLMPEYLISPEEFNAMLNNSPNIQTKLIIELLYETGARISEILDLKIQNVEWNSYGAKLYVHGKTGQRVIPIVWFANDLRHVIETHPFKDKPDSNLFYMALGDKILEFRYETFRKQLNQICQLAGIKKRIHPHLFRHTRMTELAKTLPEQTLKSLAGWSAGSNMAQVYIHLSTRDVEDSLLQKIYGISLSREKEDHNSVKVCPRCKETNPYFNNICQRCGSPLNDKELLNTMTELTPEKAQEMDKMAALLLGMLKSNPSMIEQLKKGLGKQ